MSISDSLFEPNDCKCELRKFYVDIRSLKDIVTDPSVKRAMDNPIFKSVNIGMFICNCPEYRFLNFFQAHVSTHVQTTQMMVNIP